MSRLARRLRLSAAGALAVGACAAALTGALPALSGFVAAAGASRPSARALRGAGRDVAVKAGRLGSESASGLGAACGAALLVAGAAGLRRAGARRRPAVARRAEKVEVEEPRARKNWRVYGDFDEPIREPTFLQTGSRSDEAPDWLTIDKWSKLQDWEKLHMIPWFKMYFDEQGRKVIMPGKKFDIAEAMDVLDKMYLRSGIKVDPNVDLWLDMTLDPKIPNQQIRCSSTLPHAWGDTKKVAVFCSPDETDAVLGMGAYKAGDALVQDIKDENIDFDVLIAKPQAMPQLARLGKILGPLKLMPSPKAGTVVQDYEQAIKQFGAGSTIELGMTWNSKVCVTVGKASLGAVKLTENIKAVLQTLADSKPAGAAKPYWGKARIKHCYSPVLELDTELFPQIAVEDDDSDEDDDDY